VQGFLASPAALPVAVTAKPAPDTRSSLNPVAPCRSSGHAGFDDAAGADAAGGGGATINRNRVGVETAAAAGAESGGGVADAVRAAAVADGFIVAGRSPGSKDRTLADSSRRPAGVPFEAGAVANGQATAGTARQSRAIVSATCSGGRLLMPLALKIASRRSPIFVTSALTAVRS